MGKKCFKFVFKAFYSDQKLISMSFEFLGIKNQFMR